MKRKLEIEIDKDSTWICKSNLDGSGEEIIWTNLTPLSFGLRSDFDISPDNEKLIYAVYSEPGRDGDIFEYTIATQTLINLTNDWDYLEDEPKFSTDGLNIIYTKNGTTWFAWPWTMFKMNTDGSSNALFQPNGVGGYRKPRYSPDGLKLVYCFSNLLGGTLSLYTCNSDGTGLQQIIPSTGLSNTIFDPIFSPDQTELAFSRNNATQLLITDLNGNILNQFDTLGIKGFYEIEWGVVNAAPSSLPVSVSISASVNPVCAGIAVTYTATPTNGGSTPQFQWQVNGNNVGTISPSFSYIPTNNDTVTCMLTSNLPGSTGNPATSAAITMIVNPLPNNIGQSTGLLPSLQTGLVAYYPFNGNANDESGNGNNGTVHATSTTDRNGIEGKAYFFDGIIDSVRVANNFFDIGADSFSISMWFNITDTTKTSQALFNTEPHAGISFVYNHWSNINHKLLYWLGSGTGTWDIAYGASTNNPLPPSTWKLLTVVKSGSTYTVFFNNQAVDTLTSVITPQHILSGFRFGMNSLLGFPYNDERFIGKLDDIRIYNRALSNDEIVCLYNGGCNNLNVELTSDTICSGSNTSLTIQNSQT
ncbi:MAG: LamG-like jellyroll fold domain-containing protein, partial [Bacteroidales bacterium]